MGTVTKTQTATANIGALFGPWICDLQISVSTITQPAVANIRNVMTKTQPATAKVSEWKLLQMSSANSILDDDYSVVHGVTYQYRVASVTGGVVGDFLYSDEVTYTGSNLNTKTQSAIAKIAIRARNNLMIGYNF